MSAVALHPEAADEAADAYSWYAERSEKAAERFVADLDRAIERIGEFPDRYPRHTHGTRVFLMRRFPFLVIYKEKPEPVTIVAIAHARRKPGYWKRRVK